MLGGVGRLTDKMINKLQSYFGMAIGQSTGKTVYEMKKAIGAVLFQCSAASNLEEKHQMRPREAYSWCEYQADKKNINTTQKDKPGLPTAVRELIRKTMNL